MLALQAGHHYAPRMTEYHAWATIRATYDPEPEDYVTSQAVLEKIKAHAATLPLPQVGIGTFNLIDAVWAVGCPNHRSGFEPVLELFQFIAATAPGSYGLIYVWD